MAISRRRENLAYGIGQPLNTLSPFPISSTRAPTTSDIADIGTVWTRSTTNAAWILASVAANTATWTPMTVNAGATIATGDLTVSVGDINVTLGDVNIAAGDLSLTAGDIDCGGHIDAIFGNMTALLFYATGDIAGVAGQNSLTNASDATLGAGVMAINSKTANPGTNAGYIKMYVGVTAVWVPYFTNISP